MSIGSVTWVLYLRTGHYQWALLKPDQTLTAQGESESPDDINIPAGARVMLVVPGEFVRVHRVAMPKRNRRKFMSALAFALEERLFNPPDEYHLVPFGAVNASSELAVAAVEHTRMREWTELASSHDWMLTGIVPEYMLLPCTNATTWVLDVTAQPCLFREDETTGATISLDEFSRTPAALMLALQQTRVKPARLRVRVSDEIQVIVIDNWRDKLDQFGIDLEFNVDSRSRLTLFCSQPDRFRQVNLLQGKYKTVDPDSFSFRQARPALGMAAALLLLAGVNFHVEYRQLNMEHARLRSQINATYMEAFPDAVNLVDPRFQMEQFLVQNRDQLGQGADQAGLLAILEQVAPLFVSHENCRVLSYTFNAGQLVIEISMQDFKALAQLEKDMASRLSIALENAELRDGRVYGVFHIGTDPA